MRVIWCGIREVPKAGERRQDARHAEACGGCTAKPKRSAVIQDLERRGSPSKPP